MIVADWIAIAIILACLSFGVFVGFGSGLKFFTSGIFGFIIGIGVCALFGTVFLDVGFVGEMLDKLASNWAGNEFLTKMHLEIIIYYIALFVIVQVVRVILVFVITKLLEADTFITKFVNKTLGAVLFLALGLLVAFLALKIVGWIGGTTAAGLYENLQGSFFNLDELFMHINPNWAPSVNPAP